MKVLSNRPLDEKQDWPAVTAALDNRFGPGSLVDATSTACAFYGDFREEDDPSWGRWGFEQWWIFPTRTVAA